MISWVTVWRKFPELHFYLVQFFYYLYFSIFLKAFDVIEMREQSRKKKKLQRQATLRKSEKEMERQKETKKKSRSNTDKI